MDLLGLVYNQLTVIEITDKRTKDGNIIVLCKCSCGNIKEISKRSLVRGTTISCGCIKSNRLKNSYIDMTGQVFGRLTVIAKSVNIDKIKNNALWVCRCSCGNIVEVDRTHLRYGHNKSCGCLVKENNSKKAKNINRAYRISKGLNPDNPIQPERNQQRKALKTLGIHKQILLRDNFTCQICNVRGGYLHVHHIIRLCEAPELNSNITNLICLCKQCHIALAHNPILQKPLKAYFKAVVSE